MATVAQLSNEYLYQREQGLIDLLSDSLHIILMDDTFAFNPDTHKVLADVSAKELGTGHGYTQGGLVLQNVILNRDTSSGNNKVWATMDDPVWTASGGNIGPTKAAIIYDADALNAPIIGCIEFTAPYTIPDTASFQLRDVQIRSTGVINS
ncbi:MAG: hypothetical protein AB1457_16310 [Chloroflexota bacterium]